MTPAARPPADGGEHAPVKRMFVISPYPGIRGPIPKHTPVLLEAIRDEGVEVVSAHWGRRREGESRFDSVSGRAEDLVSLVVRARRVRPDVVILKTSHEWRTLVRDIPLLAGLRACGLPTVIQYHGSQPDALAGADARGLRFGTDLALDLCEGILVLSTDERKAFEFYRPALPCRIVANPYLRPAVAPARLAPLEAAERCRASGGLVVLFVGRVIRSKGILDALAAIGALASEGRFHLLVAGDGKLRESVEEQVAAPGLDSMVTMLGYLDDAGLAASYATADALLLPTWWGEGFPTVIAEAMGNGLPIVTTPARGAVDHLIEGTNALFVPAREPVAIAGALLRLLRDPELRASMGRANLALVRRFAPEPVAREYLAAVNDILSGGHT